MRKIENIKLYKKEVISITIISAIFTVSTYFGAINAIKYKQLEEKIKNYRQDRQAINKTISILQKTKLKKLKKEKIKIKFPISQEGKIFLNNLYQNGLLFLEKFEIKKECKEKKCENYIIIEGEYASEKQ